MRKTTALIVLSLFVIMPLLIAGFATAGAESYAVPLPGEISEPAPAPSGINLTPIFEALIALLAALITGKLIPWLRSKTTEKQFANLEAAARVAVFAAEQIFGAGDGDAKLEYAVQKLRDHGFDLDAGLLREAVESVVYDMNYEKRFDEREEAREARKINAAAKEEEDDLALPPMEDWPLETLAACCRDNDIPCEGCTTKRDYLRALNKFFGTEDAPDASAAPEVSAQAAASEEDSEAPVSKTE